MLPSVKSRLAAQRVRPKKYTEPLLDVSDIQGDALLGFNKPYLAILAIDLADDKLASTTANFKRWLNDYVIPNVTSARDVILFRDMYRLMREHRGGIKPKHVAHVCFNVSFSYDALVKLAPVDDVEKFYRPGVNAAFKMGLATRSRYLQDPLSGKRIESNRESSARHQIFRK